MILVLYELREKQEKIELGAEGGKRLKPDSSEYLECWQVLYGTMFSHIKVVFFVKTV